MTKVVIFEFNPQGHRLYYVRSIARAVLDLGLVPVLAAPNWMPKRSEFAANLGDVSGTIEVRGLEMPETYSSRRARYAAAVTALAKEEVFRSADVIYLPSGDGVAQLAGLKPWFSRGGKSLRAIKRKTEVLILGGNHGYPVNWRRRAHDRVSRLALNARSWRRIFHLDPFQHHYLQRNDDSRWMLMPDPVETRQPEPQQDSRQRLGVPLHGRCVGCAGAIESKKGSDLLLAAFKHALPRLSGDVFLLLAGPCDAKMKRLVCGEYRPLLDAGRVVVLDRFLGDDAFNAAINSMDIVCLPYRKTFRSSGIFLHATAAGKQLITSDQGWLARTMNYLGQKHCVDVLDRDALSGAIVDLAGRHMPPEVSDCVRRRSFLEFHSHDNFRATWTSLLRRESGIPQASGLRKWDAGIDLARVPS